MTAHPARHDARPAGRASSTHEAHGWRVASTRPLHALASADPTNDHPELSVSWSDDPSAAGSRTSAADILRCETSDGVSYNAQVQDDGLYDLRFPGCCTFTISADLSTATCVPDGGVDPALTVVLAGGALLAFVMALRGHCVLHASAVQVGGAAVAIVGASGFGKSTVTAALCTGGCALVTDDVLRVDLDASGAPLAHRGTRELRLRPGARALAQRFAQRVPQRETEDARLAIRPIRTQHSVLPLGALVIPRPRQDVVGLAMHRVDPMAALRHLLAYPRLSGWRDKTVLQRQLRDLAQLSRRVPLYIADLPLGAPFPHETSQCLQERLSDIVGAPAR